MIDRTYLPFKSAREYRDRGMAKWMGFFLSEHQTALHDQEPVVGTEHRLARDQVFILLGQAYSNRLDIHINFKRKKRTYHIRGRIIDLTPTSCICRSQDGDERILISEIIHMDWEGDGDELPFFS